MRSKNSNQTAFWQQHLQKYRASGLTRKAYCLEHGLTINQLVYQIKQSSAKDDRISGAFAQVVTCEPKPMAPAERFVARLVLGRGITFEVDSGVDPAWIARLISHVGGQA